MLYFVNSYFIWSRQDLQTKLLFKLVCPSLAQFLSYSLNQSISQSFLSSSLIRDMLLWNIVDIPYFSFISVQIFVSSIVWLSICLSLAFPICQSPCSYGQFVLVLFLSRVWPRICPPCCVRESCRCRGPWWRGWGSPAYPCYEPGSVGTSRNIETITFISIHWR